MTAFAPPCRSGDRIYLYLVIFVSYNGLSLLLILLIAAGRVHKILQNFA